MFVWISFKDSRGNKLKDCRTMTMSEDHKFGSDPIVLSLNQQEALVLYELLCTLRERSVIPYEHYADETVMSHLEAQLEPQLPMLFDPYYSKLHAAARSMIAPPDEDLNEGE